MSKQQAMSISIVHSRMFTDRTTQSDIILRKKEYNSMLKGGGTSATVTEGETEITPFEYIGFFLLITVPLLFCLTCIFFWRRSVYFLSQPPSLSR
jgi:hypothetical protein